MRVTDEFYSGLRNSPLYSLENISVSQKHMVSELKQSHNSSEPNNVSGLMEINVDPDHPNKSTITWSSSEELGLEFGLLDLSSQQLQDCAFFTLPLDLLNIIFQAVLQASILIPRERRQERFFNFMRPEVIRTDDFFNLMATSKTIYQHLLPFVKWSQPLKFYEAALGYYLNQRHIAYRQDVEDSGWSMSLHLMKDDQFRGFLYTVKAATEISGKWSLSRDR